METGAVFFVWVGIMVLYDQSCSAPRDGWQACPLLKIKVNIQLFSSKIQDSIKVQTEKML